MITITKEHKIYIACQPVDFRKGIDGYAALCRSRLRLNPFSGHCFIFRNKKRTAIKILIYENKGFWLCHKRLSKGQFKRWPTQKSEVVLMDSQQLNPTLAAMKAAVLSCLFLRNRYNGLCIIPRKPQFWIGFNFLRIALYCV